MKATILGAAVAAGGWVSVAGGQGSCPRPGLDLVPGTHPYGPVVPDNGTTDTVVVQTATELELQFSVGGLDHGASLAVSGNYLTAALYNLGPVEVPLSFGTCGSLYLDPASPLLIVPPSLSLGAQFGAPGEVYVQTASVELGSFQLAFSDLLHLRIEAGPATVDPSTYTQYNCHYFGNYTWNAGDGVGPVDGRVYWPSLCGDGTDDPPGPLPLVVVVHGDGHDHLDYNYLLRHLARNGFIAASIDGGWNQSNVERAERLRTFVGFLRNHWSKKAFVQNDIALLGHSRGGEAVLTAARKFGDWGLDHDVNAVICLAPTDNDEDGGLEGLESLSGNDSPALLVIYGSMDEDVYGYCVSGNAAGCGAVPGDPQATGFSLYDRAGGEGSTEYVGSGSTVVNKTMLFVERATHNGWRETCINPGLGVFNPPLDCGQHQDLLRGYANAFLRWRLHGQSEFESYFTGDWKLPLVAADGLRVLVQHSSGPGRRVIDNFENGAWAAANIGTVTKETQVTIVQEGPLFDHGNFTSPHDTDGLVVRWSTHPLLVEPWLRWNLPAGGTLFGHAYRDLTKFETLSLRLGLMHGAAQNPVGQPTNLYLRLRDGSGALSPKVSLNAFAELTYPHSAQVVNPLQDLVSAPKSSLRTARVPLEFFTGIDLDDVHAIELVFGDNAHLQGELLLDSLELE
jgi:hypothetical protein